MELTAVIPVRAGSTRIPDKNIRPFAESNLLTLKVEQLKRIKTIKEIVVSSDSTKMLKLAEDLGVKAKRRPDIYCDEKTKSFNDVVEYIAANQVETDTTLWAPVVCPLLEDNSLNLAIETFKKIELREINADSVVSALPLKEYVFDEMGPANFSVQHHVKSQQLPRWHTIQNGFFIAHTANMRNWKFVYGSNPYLFEINKMEAIDIDEMIEFKLAEYIYMNRDKV